MPPNTQGYITNTMTMGARSTGYRKETTLDKVLIKVKPEKPKRHKAKHAYKKIYTKHGDCEKTKYKRDKRKIEAEAK